MVACTTSVPPTGMGGALSMIVFVWLTMCTMSAPAPALKARVAFTFWFACVTVTL